MTPTSRASKRYLPRSLFGRSLLILTVPVVLIQIVTAIVFLDRHWSHITSRLSYAIAGEIVALAQMVEDDPNDSIIPIIGKNLSLHIKLQKNTQISQNPVVKTKIFSWESLVLSSLDKELKGLTSRNYSIHVDLKSKIVQINMQTKNGVLNVRFPARRVFSSSSYIFLMWMLGTSILLLMVAILFMRGQVRPIRRLAVAANKLGKGQDIPAFKPTGSREVRQAAQAFIDMQRRIKRQIEQRTLMLAGISHDLRTPLTRLKLNMAMLPETKDKAAMEADVKDMEQMINGYLSFVEQNTTSEDIKTVNLNAFITDLVRDAKRQNIQNIKTDTSKTDGFISLRTSSMRRSINNIIENAAKYGGNIIYVTTDQDDHYTYILIEDNGDGLPEDERKNVLRPFYRADQSRNLETGGTGLGLSIAQDIVHAHGGQIILDQSTYGGLSVTIKLPS